MRFDSLQFIIAFKSYADVGDEVENYLTSIEGEILSLNEEGAESLIGKLRAFYADLDGASNVGLDPYYILDLLAATAPFYHSLFDAKTNDFKRSVYRVASNDIINLNLLILDRLEILPEYRGKGLGLACLYRCIQQYWHGCALVTLKCFPLQFENDEDDVRDEWQKRMNLGRLGKDHDICRSKLEKYYQRLGFKKVRGTEIMIMNPHHKQPRFEDFGF